MKLYLEVNDGKGWGVVHIAEGPNIVDVLSELVNVREGWMRTEYFGPHARFRLTGLDGNPPR